MTRLPPPGTSAAVRPSATPVGLLPDGRERPALVVALDVPTLWAAADLVPRLRPVTAWFKVGATLFTAAGPEAVRLVQAAGGRVFLDLKLHDIPQSVAGGVSAALDLGVELITVHCAGGPAVMEAAARAAAAGGGRLRVLGVTRLTSDGGRMTRRVVAAARSARAAGLHGVTASARECAAIKRACGAAFEVLTPGIRRQDAEAGDQARTATPRQAVRAGSDYLVVGRPILSAAEPAGAARAILDEMTEAGRRRRRSRP